MEAVGGVASIITLIEATGVLAGVSKDLVLRWRNAPHEIQALATRLSLLAAELQSIKNVTARSHPVLTDAIIRQSLSDLLTDVRKRLTKLESLHFRLEQHGPVRQKFQWTVKDAGSVEKMLSKTQEVEQRLANLMTLISMRAQTPILYGLDRIEQMVSTLVISLPASMPVAPATPSVPCTDYTTSAPSRFDSGIVMKRTLTKFPWESGKTLESWGLRGALITTRQGHYTDCSFNFSALLPLPRILGSYAITGCLSFRSTPLCRSAFTFRHPSYFAVARVVDKNHPFMLACSDGDIKTVRFMLRTGDGRPTDMTAEGETPMLFASKAGNIEVVAELLESGVEVDVIACLDKTMTMLELASEVKNLDLVRFLLRHGASPDHMCSVGSGASALCWFHSDLETDHLSVDIYNVLSESSYVDLHRDEYDRAVAVELAAWCGCGSQIDTLVRFGYNIFQSRFGPMKTIEFAATRGNYSAYSALVSHFGGDIFANDTYVLAYLLESTILGKDSYSFEHDDVLRDILQRCGDNRLRPLPPRTDTNPRLSAILSKEMKPSELAAALGPETEAWYLGMVRSCGFLSVDEESEVMQRLRELSLAGHVTTGLIYEVGEETGESGGYRGSGSEDWNEDSALSEEGIEEPDTGVDDGCKSSTESEADQFWDAPESI